MRKLIPTLVISGVIVVASLSAVEAQQYQTYREPMTPYYGQYGPSQRYVARPRVYAPEAAPLYEGRNTATVIYPPAPFFPGAAANSEAAIQWQENANDAGGGGY